MHEAKAINAANSAEVEAQNPGEIIEGAGTRSTVQPAETTAEVVEAKEATEERSDSYGRDQLPKEKSSVRDDGTTRRSGESPFAERVRRIVAMPTRSLAGRPIALDETIDLPLPMLQCMASLESELGPEHAGVFAKLRAGAMLLAGDAQTATACNLPVDKTSLEQLANRIVETNGAFTGDEADVEYKLGPQVPRVVGSDTNVNDVVMWVLRECYMIQSDLLMDYAAKVKHYNELKKAVRGQLNDMRPIHSSWVQKTSQLGTEVEYFAENPVDYMVLNDNGEWVQDLTSQEDVDHSVDVTSSDGSPSRTGSSGALADAHRQLYGSESRLTVSEQAFLDRMKNANNNTLKDEVNWERLISLLPKMNADEIIGCLFHILDQLNGRGPIPSPDSERILEILGALPATHLLYVVELGLTSGKLNLNPVGPNAGKFWDLVLQAGEDVAAALGTTLVTRATEHQVTVTKEEAGRLLAMLRDATRATDESGASEPTGEAPREMGPAVGDPKVIRTAAEMESYIEALEEQLNTIGDDAQLANVDLQNALQKQQQTLQMMSNMSKVLHETAMSIVRKMGS